MKKKVKSKGYSSKNAYLMLIVLIVVGVGVVYLFVNQIYSTGSAVRASKCIDSDTGLNYYKPSYVTYNQKVYRDSCVGNVLSEKYCSNGMLRSKNYVCPDGCSNGRCINTNILEICDPGTLEYKPCGYKCGRQTRICDSTGQWGPWRACSDEGVCVPGFVGSCFTITGFSGTHTCSSACKWGECNSGKCGNGEIDAGEDCEGYNLNDKSCDSLGNFSGGILRCAPNCKFDTSKCIA